MTTSRVTTWAAHTTLDGTEVIAVDHANTNKSVTSSSLRVYMGSAPSLKWGQISVSTSDGLLSLVQATADGAADDRSIILGALTTALANLPAIVEFGPGKFGISGGIEIKPAQGQKGLMIKGQGPNITKIIFNGDGELVSTQYIAFKIIPSVTPDPRNDYTKYVQDIYFRDIGFFDDDPVLHASSEESHAISMQYVINAGIVNCDATDIGDEAFNFTFVDNGIMSKLKCTNVPSVGSGGGAITVQHGSSNVTVEGCQVRGSNTPGTKSTIPGGHGIHLEHTSATGNFDSKNITVSNNNVSDFGGAAFKIASNTTGSHRNVVVSSNNFTNCQYGVSKTGVNNIKDTSIVGNVITNMSATAGSGDTVSYGIKFPGTPDETLNTTISGNTITDVDTAALINIQTATVSSNTYKSCTRGIHITNGIDINISSSTFDGCGGTNLEEVEDTTSSTTTKVSDLLIKNSNTSSASIKGVASLDSTIIGPRSASSPENCVYFVSEVTNCNLAGGIRPKSNAPAKICNNKIAWNDTGGANSAPGILLQSTSDNSVISGNQIDLSGSSQNQYCIKIPAGSTDTLVVGNNLKAKTAGLSNAFNNAGTGTIANFTIANLSS
jgi:hypothetical protein